jgi:hypothetical protein
MAHAYVALRLVPGVLEAVGLPWALALGTLLAASTALVPQSLHLQQRANAPGRHGAAPTASCGSASC